MFVLWFLEIVLNILIGLAFFMIILIGAAYSVYNMYRLSRSAQFHIGLSIIILGVLLALTHLLSPYRTVLTNNVNLFQDSVVHGLSFTDQYVNIPVSYILAVVALLGAIWFFLALRKGNLNQMLIPIFSYFAVLLLTQVADCFVAIYI